MNKIKILITFIILLFFAGGLHTGFPTDFSTLREQLIERHIIADGIKDSSVIDSMRTVPRELFVPERYKRQAYKNRPLPIGYGQTISQPYIVALMTELLRLKKSDVVLEVGTGSGYQAAICSRIAKEVYTIEIIEPLSIQAKKRFAALGYSNIHTKVGDGYYGWKEHAPYDAIIVTAAASHIPPPLITQLKKGGRMCIPVGPPFFTQTLKLIEKKMDGSIIIQDIAPVMFVPLTGGH